MEVNYCGVVNVLQAALPGMVAAGKGRVVVTGSMGEKREGFFFFFFSFLVASSAGEKKKEPTSKKP